MNARKRRRRAGRDIDELNSGNVGRLRMRIGGNRNGVNWSANHVLGHKGEII